MKHLNRLFIAAVIACISLTPCYTTLADDDITVEFPVDYDTPTVETPGSTSEESNEPVDLTEEGTYDVSESEPVEEEELTVDETDIEVEEEELTVDVTDIGVEDKNKTDSEAEDDEEIPQTGAKDYAIYLVGGAALVLIACGKLLMKDRKSM